MISIIISSIDSSQLSRLKDNIAATVGIPFEIIAFQNASGDKGLCEIYNMGAKQAHFEYLCFMHEDVLIHTANWGEKVVGYFKKDASLGIVGIAGSDFKSSVTGGCDCVNGNFFINVIQYYKFSDREPQHICIPQEPKTFLNEVTCVDGVWFTCRRTLALEHPFDENLKGFHGYDIDFSLEAIKYSKIFVSHEILLTHYSEGNFSNEWLQAMLYIHKKRKDQLPVYVQKHIANISTIEKRNFRYLVKQYQNSINISFLDGYKILKFSKLNSFGIFFHFKVLVSLIKIFVFKK